MARLVRRPTMVLLAAVVWVTAFGALDLVTRDLSLFGTLSLAAVGTALFCPPAYAAVIGAYAFAWSIVLGVEGDYFTPLHLLRLGISLFVVVSAIVLATVRERRERSYARLEDVALAAQRALLRPIPERVGPTRLAARYRSAAEGALVGGDFYEAVLTPFGVRIIVGDVVGRGLDAVGLSGLILGGFREAALTAPDLVALAHRLDGMTTVYGRGTDFATALLAELADGEVRLASCGHPSPLLVGPGASATPLELPPTLPLGYGATPRPRTVAILPGQRLLLYTDGIAEARDADGRFFDLEAEAGRALADESAEEGLDRLLDRLDAFAGGALRDDVALLVVGTASA